MKTTAFALAFTWAVFLTAYKRNDCPREFRIGQTYQDIKDGPCPDIEKQARWADSTTASYLCPSKMVVVVGSRQTRKMVGFFLWNGQ